MQNKNTLNTLFFLCISGLSEVAQSEQLLECICGNSSYWGIYIYTLSLKKNYLKKNNVKMTKCKGVKYLNKQSFTY